MEKMMVNVNLDHFETVRTTVTLPADLVKQSQRFVDDGTVPSRNALIVAALEHFLAELERQEIDRQFAALAKDAEYQELNERLDEEFADADWEALTLAEETKS
jgi:metal-responsive CopG/Arc/MetJ family transcriptional regulator